MTLTDEELVREYGESAGKESAGELVRRYLPKVRRIVFAMVLDHAHADDITQDVMIKAVAGLRNFRQEATFSTWITRITLNTTYTFLQRNRRQQATKAFPPQEVEASMDDSPVHAAIGKELNAKIRSALAELSPKLRAAMALTMIDGFSPKEAAEIENCTPATMHTRVHEARKQLRGQLKDYFKASDEP